MFYSVLFCVCLITANVLETKQISFGPANMTAGLIVFPVSYIINDVVCEVWVYGRTRLLIWLGFAMNFLSALLPTGSLAHPTGTVKRVSTRSSAWHPVLQAPRSWPSSADRS